MYGITLFNRHGQLALPPPGVDLAVTRLCWESQGGPAEAQLSARGDERSLLELAKLVGYPLEIWDEAGDAVWWGYLAALEINDRAGRPRLKLDLAEMANRIWTAYTFTVDEGGPLVVQHLLTDWADDPDSQAQYGIKEKIIPAGEVPLGVAENLRDMRLAEISKPGYKIITTAPEPHPERGGQGEVLSGRSICGEVTCRG